MKESENLEIEHVKKIFQIKDVSFEVLTDIDLKIRAGEFIEYLWGERMWKEYACAHDRRTGKNDRW